MATIVNVFIRICGFNIFFKNYELGCYRRKGTRLQGNFDAML